MSIQPIGNVTQSGSPVAPTPDANTSSTPAPATTVAASENSAAATAIAGDQSEPSIDKVNQAVQKINTAMAAQSQGIEFAVDSTSHRIVVKIIDQQSNQVIRQIPSKEALAIADSLDQTQGLLIKQQA